MTPQQYADQIKYPTFALGFFAYLLSVAAANFDLVWRDAMVAVFFGGFLAALFYLIAYHTAAFLPFIFDRLPPPVDYQPEADTPPAPSQPTREQPTRHEFTAPREAVAERQDYDPRHLSLFLQAIDRGDIKVRETVTLGSLDNAKISRFDNRGGDSSAVQFRAFLRRVGVLDSEDTLVKQPPPPRQMDSPHLF